MTDDLDRLLRDTVTDLAEESEPRDLMPAVLVRARRIRRRQHGRYLAAALAATLLLVVPYLSVHRDRGLPPVTVSPSTSVSVPPPSVAPPPANLDQPVTLPYGWVVTAASHASPGVDGGFSYVLDRAAHRYVRLDYPIAWPAPTGPLVAMVKPDLSGLGLLDRTHPRDVNWALTRTVRYPEWSPDGRRLLVTLPEGGFAVIDAANGAVNPHQLDLATLGCNDDCTFTWYPDGRQVVVAQTDTSVPHSEALPDVQRGLRLFDAGTGAPGALLPVHGIVARVGDWSPDRRTVLVTGTVVEGASRHFQYQLVETATGRVLATFPGHPLSSWWVDNQRLLSQSDRLKVCGVRATGQVESCATLPTAFFQLDLAVGPA